MLEEPQIRTKKMSRRVDKGIRRKKMWKKNEHLKSRNAKGEGEVGKKLKATARSNGRQTRGHQAPVILVLGGLEIFSGHVV